MSLIQNKSFLLLFLLKYSSQIPPCCCYYSLSCMIPEKIKYFHIPSRPFLNGHYTNISEGKFTGDIAL